MSHPSFSQRLKQGGSDLLYSLIQPYRVPEHPKPPPRLRVEVLITLLGLAGWILFASSYDRASPAASLDLRYSRDDIAGMAGDYARTRGYDLAGYRQVVTFGGDFTAQIYLERTAGMPELNRLVREEQLPVWWWHVRWFRPEQQEEYNVYLLPSGELVAFFRTLPEDAAGASVSPEEARRLAEAYLVDDRGLALDDWDLYDVSAETLPNRTDHHLIWVQRGFQIGEGDLRVSVTVQGDEVGGHDTWFRVPEAFERDYAHKRSQALLINEVALGLSMAFGLGGLAIVLWGLGSGLHVGRMPIVAGLVAGLVDLADSLNYLPLIDAGYNTASDYQSYILGRLSGYAANALVTGLLVAILFVAARWLLRAVWPRQHKLKPDPRATWPNLARSAWRGMMVGGLWAAYLILFYTVADGLGAWSPMRTPPLNLLATPFPFLAAISLGLLPALEEELTTRALGTGLVQRLSRGQTWLAVLLPSLFWGFAHAGYHSDPVALRGVELTLLSLVVIMPTFLLTDLTTTMVAHYTYNASLYAIVFVRSGQPGLVAGGWLAVLLGLLPVVVLLVRRLLGRRRREPLGLAAMPGDEADWPAVQALCGGELAGAGAPECLVCLRSGDGRLLGFAGGQVVEGAAGDPVGEVTAIHIAETLRGRYFGTALYRALRQCFRAQGARRVRVGVPLGQPGLSTFWTVQGYRPRARLWMKDLAEE